MYRSIQNMHPSQKPYSYPILPRSNGVIFISTLALCASDRGLCHGRARGYHSTSIFFVSCNLQITTLPCPILSCRGVELGGSFVQVVPYPVGSRKTYNAAPNHTHTHGCEVKPCLLTPNPQGYRPKQEMKAQKKLNPNKHRAA